MEFIKSNKRGIYQTNILQIPWIYIYSRICQYTAIRTVIHTVWLLWCVKNGIFFLAAREIHHIGVRLFAFSKWISIIYNESLSLSLAFMLNFPLSLSFASAWQESCENCKWFSVSTTHILIPLFILIRIYVHWASSILRV